MIKSQTKLEGTSSTPIHALIVPTYLSAKDGSKPTYVYFQHRPIHSQAVQRMKSKIIKKSQDDHVACPIKLVLLLHLGVITKN